MLLPLLVKKPTCPPPTLPSPRWVFPLTRAERDAGGGTRVRCDAVHLEELLPSHSPGEPRHLTRDAPLGPAQTTSHPNRHSLVFLSEATCRTFAVKTCTFSQHDSDSTQ